MRILYDLCAAQPLHGNHHGGGTHALAVLERLLERRAGEDLSVFFDPGRWVPSDMRARLEEADVPLIAASNQASLQALIDTGCFDLLYSSLPYRLGDLDLSSMDFVMTIHGLRPLEMPADRQELRYANGWLRRGKTVLRHAGLPLYLRRERNRFARLIWCNARSKRIVVPSTHTKHALLTEFPSLAPESITVSYSPLRKGIDAEEVVKRTPCVLREHGLESRKFFLVVNAGRWIKNAYRALTALDAFFQARAEVEHKAIFLGVRPGQRLPHHARSRQRFVFHDYVSDETLQMLYRSAFALIYATLNEGFGYPPLEAMRWGTPVICSAVTSLPEVCDSGVLYCNPLHVHEITNRISQLVFEPGRWDDYSRRGRERYQEVAELQRASLDRICGLILGRA